MSKNVQGNPTLANSIKSRRNELGLTIEEAAKRAGIGTKTWSRYESGESIREDKCKGVCKALNWGKLPEIENIESDALNMEEYRAHEAWSTYIEKEYGTSAAVSFVVGIDILLDHVDMDLEELSEMPAGTHVGELGASFLVDALPPQFLMKYDYNFIYVLRSNVLKIKRIAQSGEPIVAKSVLDELTLFMVVDQARMLLDNVDCLEDDWADWIFDVFDDMDIVTFLYSDQKDIASAKRKLCLFLCRKI